MAFSKGFFFPFEEYSDATLSARADLIRYRLIFIYLKKESSSQLGEKYSCEMRFDRLPFPDKAGGPQKGNMSLWDF